MRIIIIEDEIPALEKLERYILKYDSEINIAAKFSSISETVKWLQNPINSFDIAFMDIQLSDGLSFEIFNQVKIENPIIFVTAFDEFAIDAFKVNSIDYILKPITFTDLSKALNKFKNFKGYSANAIERTTQAFEKKNYKSRFLVKLGNHIHSIEVKDIALFYAEGRTVFLVTNNKKKYILDFKLEDLGALLSPKDFFRVGRTYIVNLSIAKDVTLYSNNRLKINSGLPLDKDIIVSRERVSSFKKWLEGDTQ